MRLLKNTFLAFALLVSTPALAQSSTESVQIRHDEHFPFIVITGHDVNTAPVFSDEDFYKTSSGVVFKSGKTDIPDTDPFIQIYRTQVLNYINHTHLQLRKVYIRGAASPEGSFSFNQYLGRERSKVLLDELSRGLEHQYVDIDKEISSITEDYGYLCILLRDANDPDYELVQRIYEETAGNELKCKNRLRAAKGGKLWPRLLKEYFPRLRSARLVLWFSEPDEEHAPEQPIPPVISRLNYKAPEFSLDSRLPIKPVEYVPAPVEEPKTRRHLIALRTNLVHDFFFMPGFGFAPSPNLQLEYYPLDGHYTFNAGCTWGTVRKWDSHQFWQVRDFELEVRRYFRGGGDFTGLYLGLYGQGDVYGIGLNDDDGWQGEGGGAGLSFGYVMPLNRKGNLRLEFMLAAGFFYSKFDPYVYGNPVTGDKDGFYYYNFLGAASAFKQRNHQLTWFGPTNLGIQLTYDIIYRRRK